MDDKNRFWSIIDEVKSKIAEYVIGQEEIVEFCIAAIIAQGHVLIEGYPGLAKTVIVKLLSKLLDINFKRIQFTPDLMPSDIIGTTIYNDAKKEFFIKKGPIFTNLLLADEINRAPAKTQSALLQGMEEREVTIDGVNYKLEYPFVCFATQNPIEMEGTYPLPEAQLDRFMFKLKISYPEFEDEKKIVTLYSKGIELDNILEYDIRPVLNKDKLLEMKEAIKNVVVDDSIIDYITKIVSNTRTFQGIEIGSSVRGSVNLFKASRVIAFINGRDYVIPDDVKKVALPVLRHRIILEPESEIQGLNEDDYLKEIIEKIEVPR